MTGVETIARIRFEHFQNRKGIKRIARELGVARDTVRKVLRSQATEFSYKRATQPQPKLGPWVETLTTILEAEAKVPRRERRCTQRLFEELRGRGYDGAHDSVHRFVKAWRVEHARAPVQAFIPLSFDPGEAYQFDWSHDAIELAGLPMIVKVAHMRLSFSRMPFVRAYPRETQEMVFDAHDKAFAFYGGVCRRGIYDNMKTAVDAVFVGRGAHLQPPLPADVLASPGRADRLHAGVRLGEGPGREPGRHDAGRAVPAPAEGQALEELNAWLEDQCRAYAQRTRHPQFKDRTIWQVFEEERAALAPFVGPFAGFSEKPMRATTTCLITHDRNKYSVDARGRRPRRAGARLCRPDRRAAGRRGRRRSSPQLQARAGGLRSLALPAGADAQARRPAQRRAVQGLGPAAGPGQGAPQAARPRRRRPPVRQDPRRRA